MTKPLSRLGLLLPAACLMIVLSCGKSPFDSSTSLGKDVIRDVDPSAVDFGANFRTITDGAVVLGGSSVLPRLHGFHRGEGGVIAGTCDGTGERAFAYVEFDTSARSLGHLKTLLSVFDTLSDSVASVSLVLPVDTGFGRTFGGGAPMTATVFNHAAPRDHALPFDSVDTLAGSVAGADSFPSADSTRIVIPLEGPGALGIAQSIGRYIRASAHDTSVANRLALAFVIECSGGLARFYNVTTLTATLVVRFHPRNGAADSISGDSAALSSYADYTVFENPGTASARDTVAVSSLASGRRAVLRFDLPAFWQAHPEAVSAASILKAHLHIGVQDLDTTFDTLHFRYALEDHPDTDTISSASLLRSGMLITSDTSTFALPVESFLLTLRQSARSAAYLTIALDAPAGKFGAVRWAAPDSAALDIVLYKPQ